LHAKQTQSRHIRYDVCFSAADRARLPRAARLARLAALATAVTAGSGAAFAAALASGSTGVAAMHPPALFAGLTAAAAAPLHVGPAPAARLLFVSTAARVATPVRPVTWSDFLLADVATSLAAPLAGGARAVCHALTAGVLAPPDEGAAELCGRAGPVAVAAAAAPFAARLAQCVRVWSDTGATPQLWNALKYGTAFPALLAAAGYERARDAAAGGGAGSTAAAESAVSAALALWVGAQLLNTCFSYFWDVERDWEIQWFTRTGGDGGAGSSPALGRSTSSAAARWAGRLAPRAPALPPARTLESRGTYHWLLASNAALRLAWLARTPWAPGWARAPLAPAVAGVLEAARRAQWCVFLFSRNSVFCLHFSRSLSHEPQTKLSHPSLAQDPRPRGSGAAPPAGRPPRAGAAGPAAAARGALLIGGWRWRRAGQWRAGWPQHAARAAGGGGPAPAARDGREWRRDGRVKWGVNRR
jgi:hypothetical protein